jgi:two-component system sensor histidine kinase ChvG
LLQRAETFSLAAILLSILIGLSLVRSVRAHSSLADEISRRRHPLSPPSARAPLWELAGDLSRTKRLMAELTRVAEQIRQASEDDAHALRSPLSVVKIAVKRVRAQVPACATTVQAALDAAEVNIERMSRVIDASQSLEEETAALIVATRQTVNLTWIVRDTLERYQDSIVRKSIRVSHLSQNGVIVSAAAGVLDALVHDVLGNAIAASPEGGTLSVYLETDDQSALIQVDDEGAGIPLDCVEVAFERDYSARGDTPTPLSDDAPRNRRRYFIAKRNAGVLGGDLTIGRRVGGGISVKVCLPLL